MGVLKTGHIDDGLVPIGADPIGMAISWLAEARAAGLPQPGALSLATHGPSVRTVQALRFDSAGLIFTTHAKSPKMRAIEADPRTSSLFHWPALGRQLIIDGLAEQAESFIADEEWDRRPDLARRMSSVLCQSATLDDRSALLRRAMSAAPDGVRPEQWIAVRIRPTRFEFWRTGEQSLHLRDEFRRINVGNGAASWSHQFLQP